MKSCLTRLIQSPRRKPAAQGHIARSPQKSALDRPRRPPARLSPCRESQQRTVQIISRSGRRRELEGDHASVRTHGDTNPGGAPRSHGCAVSAGARTVSSRHVPSSLRLQFSDLIVPIAEIEWKDLSRKALAKQLPGTVITRVVVLRGGLSVKPVDCSSMAGRFPWEGKRPDCSSG